MANLSEMTREEQVLHVLTAYAGRWVDGPLLANEKIGGSEGLKRLRELKQKGYLIQKRKHPDPARAIYQYRLVEQAAIEGAPSTWVPPPQKDLRNGRGGSDDNHPRSDRAPRPVSGQTGAFMDPAPLQPEKHWHEWRPSKRSSGILETTYWLRNPKRRVVGSIGTDLGGGYFWGVLVPEYRGRGAESPAPAEQYGGSAPDKEAARFAVEEQMRKLRGANG